jgi:O-antigen/teichoic acid export membrane protein
LKKALKIIIREDNFLSLTGNLVYAVFGFASFALMARTFEKDIFGEWVLFIASAAFVEMFRFGITNTAVVRYISGASPEERMRLIGSNSLIGLVVTTFIVLVLVICNLAFAGPIQHSGYGLFFTWYPLLAFINLPINNALVIFQADRKFGRMLLLKAINSGGFFLMILVNFLALDMSLNQLVWAMFVTNGISSGLCLYYGWDGTRHLGQASRHANRTILSFGKYTTFTLIGTNLLRSADTLIISLSPLGTAAVALYSIPLKLTELQQIPLRSFVATAFPKMSKASIQGKVGEVRRLFYNYSGALSYLFIFLCLATFVFAEFFVLLLGGREYLGVDPVTGFNTVNIVRIFSIYGLLLPVDRMTGIALDSINKPGINAIKVFFMVLANIIGNLVAVFVFKSLELVAVGSIVFTILGIWIGFYFLDKEIQLHSRQILINGFEFYRSLYFSFIRQVIHKAI